MEQIAYHLTPAENLACIRTEGLTPRIGERASSAREITPAIWLFPNLTESKNALTNWYSEATQGIEQIALLEVIIPPEATLHIGADYELGILTTISASQITVITDDVDKFSFTATTQEKALQ